MLEIFFSPILAGKIKKKWYSNNETLKGASIIGEDNKRLLTQEDWNIKVGSLTSVVIGHR